MLKDDCVLLAAAFYEHEPGTKTVRRREPEPEPEPGPPRQQRIERRLELVGVVVRDHATGFRGVAAVYDAAQDVVLVGRVDGDVDGETPDKAALRLVEPGSCGAHFGYRGGAEELLRECREYSSSSLGARGEADGGDPSATADILGAFADLIAAWHARGCVCDVVRPELEAVAKTVYVGEVLSAGEEYVRYHIDLTRARLAEMLRQGYAPCAAAAAVRQRKTTITPY